MAQTQHTTSHPSPLCQSQSLLFGRSTWSGEEPGLLGLGGVGYSLNSNVLGKRELGIQIPGSDGGGVVGLVS